MLLPVHAQRLAPAGVTAWVTTPDQAQLLHQQPGRLAFQKGAANGAVIDIDDSQTYQTMDGFGYCLTGGSAELLHGLSAPARAKLLRELFGTGANDIGVSYLRLSIGASDLDAQTFSYDDIPAGQTDPTLAHFSLGPDEQHLIPVLKEILAINPAIKLLGSPWSPPAWMKTNEATKGGSLKPEYYAAYAQYFVKYLQGMQAHGITLEAVTPQNEPLHPGNNPSLLLPAEQEAEFIGRHLGPALRAAGLKTRIICYDHNADKPEYPLTVLGNAMANPYVDGSAFHLYAGPIEALSQVHDAFPTKNIYFTEQWVGSKTDFAGNLGWHAKTLFIGAPRNWARTVLEWNLAADPQQNPHTPGGCTECLGAITVAPGGQVTRNVAYYVVAHASKWVRPGAVRIGSTSAGVLPNVAYRTPAGGHVLLVQNDQATAQIFNLRYKGQSASATLPAGAVATYVW
ncbi:glycoside hydrolase family 30 protein [Hymenobacter sp. BRD67]|uniref:glycoside hydrolase family 30 protein n=1 Tax=Hymenobacter sp. BRD67 TaxID=2675877 RepID=UPI0015669140|nr:glycoside hydrolase family 30 beta sandwich domain-containing protein [Hymenobacter sp. BRD67]QKG54573.1 glucosylceramidase [Hymenobacter sp. BRD67]